MPTKLLENKKLLLIVTVCVLALVLTALIVTACLLANRQKPAAEKPKNQPPQQVESLLEENNLTPKDFVYENGFLTCTTTPSVLGIDVSGFQGQIDWEQVRDAGVKFVMIRVGGRGYGESGSLYDDSKAPEYYAGAKAAGLAVGAYIFSQATCIDEAVEEAEYALSLTEGWEMDMPLVCDWEYMGPDTYAADVDPRTLTDSLKAFCQTVKAAGRQPMVYFNPDHSKNQLYLEELVDYPFWLAMYSDQMDYPYRVDMWQYTDQGSVPGITGNVDINLYFPE